MSFNVQPYPEQPSIQVQSRPHDQSSLIADPVNRSEKLNEDENRCRRSLRSFNMRPMSQYLDLIQPRPNEPKPNESSTNENRLLMSCR